MHEKPVTETEEALARAYIVAVREAQKNPCYECQLPRCPDCGMECLPFESWCVKCGAGKFFHSLEGVPLNEKIIRRAKQLWVDELIVANARDEPEPTLPRRDGRVAAELLRVASRLVELAAALVEDG